MQKYTDVVLSTSGTPIGGATITVTNYPDGTPATIYASDGGTAVGSVTSDPTGRFAFYAADGHYSITIGGTGLISQTIDDVTLNDPSGEATTAALAGNGGAGIVGWLRSATGAVKRWLSDKLSDRVSVRDFTGDTVDGTTSNQAGIAAAVAYCYANGKELHWPAGTYVSDANIPNFHDVQHSGNGVIKRGTDTWKVSGNTGTNTIYVATTGNDANDGLTASQPKATAQAAFNALSGWAIQLLRNGTFKVQFAAGTYNAASSLVGLRSKNRIVIAGPSVGGHPNVPTAIIDGTSINNSVGMYLQANVYAQVQDIKYQNWTYGSDCYGLALDGHCDVITNNVHAYNCGYAGVSSDNLTQIRMMGGVIDSCPNYGVRVYSQSSASIGYTNMTAGSTSTTVGSSTVVKNCGTGVYGANSSRVHVDYCDINNNSVGLLVEKNSRSVANYVAFTSNTIASRWQLDSVYGESGATNTFTTNGKNYVGYQGSDDVGYTYTYWDRANLRTLYGASAYRNVNAKYEWQLDSAASGSSYNANVKAIYDFNSSTNYLGLSGPTTSSVGWLWSTVSKAAQGSLSYFFSDDSLRIGVNGLTTGYRFNSSKFGADQDASKTLGDNTFRWLNVYSQNIELTPPASVTPSVNGAVSLQLTSNTQLTFKVKGSDGVVRSASLTLA